MANRVEEINSAIEKLRKRKATLPEKISADIQSCEAEIKDCETEISTYKAYLEKDQKDKLEREEYIKEEIRPNIQGNKQCLGILVGDLLRLIKPDDQSECIRENLAALGNFLEKLNSDEFCMAFSVEDLQAPIKIEPIRILTESIDICLNESECIREKIVKIKTCIEHIELSVRSLMLCIQNVKVFDKDIDISRGEIIRLEMRITELEAQIASLRTSAKILDAQILQLQNSYSKNLRFFNLKNREASKAEHSERVQPKVQAFQEAIQCPITCVDMEEPVVIEDGHSYEKAAIETWLNDNTTSPVTGLAVKDTPYLPNHTLKNIITAVQTNQPYRALLKCPLTHEIMQDPVVLVDGHSYERKAIEAWLKEHNTSPVTKEPLSTKVFYPNLVLKHVIELLFTLESTSEPTSRFCVVMR